jgi:hypothetical protein
MADVTLSLVSHTNVGKTALARTLLGRDIGEVRDAPHVTELAERHELIASPAGDRLLLWDTPGFGDSARLARRLRQSSNPLGWLLSQVWDRWRDRPFWASQQVMRHVRAESDLVLYLVNASESPAAAGYVAAEMELLAWLGKPVLVLLNQLGAPRAADEEAAEATAWREHLARWPLVQDVLPMDAFARCWVHEQVLLAAVQRALQAGPAHALARLAAAWAARQQGTFEASMQALAESLALLAGQREAVEGDSGWADRLRRLGAALAQRGDATPAAAAQRRLAEAGDGVVRASTTRLLALHGVPGQVQGEILARVATQFTVRERVSEGGAAIVGGAVSGALAGLKADIATGGLTLGGGLLAGGLLGALGAAGLARGINLVRGTDASEVTWSDPALHDAVEAALLRYLAVAHFGRGRGDWAQGEAPPHWHPAVVAALAPHREALQALWQRRGGRSGKAPTAAALAQALRPLLEGAARDTLAALYPAGGDPVAWYRAATGDPPAVKT